MLKHAKNGVTLNVNCSDASGFCIWICEKFKQCPGALPFLCYQYDSTTVAMVPGNRSTALEASIFCLYFTLKYNYQPH